MLLALTMGVIGLAGRLPEARRVKRELARTRRVSLAALPDGKVVTVRGTVRELGETVTAPLSRRGCVYFLVVFDEVGTGGDYRELGRLDGGAPFRIESDGGTARVVPGTPQLALPAATYMRPAHELAAGGERSAMIYLAQRVCRAPNYPATSWLRATEYVLAPGDEVTVKGWCTHEPDPDAAPNVDTGYRGELPSRAVISGSRRTPLMIG